MRYFLRHFRRFLIARDIYFIIIACDVYFITFSEEQFENYI